MVLFTISALQAQEIKKAERGRLSGATKDAIDTLALQNAQSIVRK
ncbi:MAG: hypothetical protein WCZ17_02875 [Candidatus Kapaibacterium sp.]